MQRIAQFFKVSYQEFEKGMKDVKPELSGAEMKEM